MVDEMPLLRPPRPAGTKPQPGVTLFYSTSSTMSSIRHTFGGACKIAKRSSSSNTPTTNVSFIRNPLQWYGHKLDTYPIFTKCVTSGIISGSGDVLCQYLNRSGNDTRCNFIRSMRFTVLGAFLVAPTVHVWYGFLMTRFPGSSIQAISKRLFCDQGLFAPIFTPTFISCLTVLEHISGKDTDYKANGYTNNFSSHFRDRLRDSPEAIVMGWQIWVPSMAIMFAAIPSKYQVLYSNCVGFIWNAYLSWKTHEGEAGGNEI